MPPDKKLADIVLDSLRDIPVGTPVEEIKRAADVFGLDFGFMEAMAKIESDFNPKQRTARTLAYFNLADLSSGNTVRETSPAPAIMLSRQPTN